MLESIVNPSNEKYEIEISIPELTFLGVKRQPDFAYLTITLQPKDKVIELKALKEYMYSFRNKIISYERLINTIYEDLMDSYDPTRLLLELRTSPRGGISSKLKIDSDWRKNEEST